MKDQNYSVNAEFLRNLAMEANESPSWIVPQIYNISIYHTLVS